MGIAESIYNYSPILIQDMLISGYGYRLKKLRYGKNYRHYLDQLMESQHYTSGELRDLQASLFRSLQEQALLHTPYYINWTKERNIHPNDITIDNYMTVLPLITKDLLRRKQDDFYCHNIKSEITTVISTSGTSGTPLNILTTASVLQRNYAFINRFLSWAGVQFGDRCATFAGRMFIPPRQRTAPYWRHNHPANTLLLSSYHISETSIPAYIRALENFNPEFIDSYPSAIYEVAKFIIAHGHDHRIRPKSIITSSETLYDYQREAIQEAFGCRVFDHLGCAEMAVLISQCEHGSYHINPEYGLFEVLDDNGQPIDQNGTGRLVCTGLVNTAMPLIRYELGDTISLSTDSCACGRNFPIAGTIVGRTDDLIIGCDGRKIGRLDPIFKKMDSSIKEAQIVQTELSSVTLRLATESTYNTENTSILVNEFHNRLGSCMKIEVEYVDSIEKTSSGKFKAVVSHVTLD